MSRSRFLRSRHRPLEDQVNAYGAVGDTVLVRRDERGRGDELPAFGAGAVDPGVEPAHHPLFAIVEDDHPIEVFPLHVSLRLPAEPSIYVASRCANDAATPPADGSAKEPRPPASSLAPRSAPAAQGSSARLLRGDSSRRDRGRAGKTCDKIRRVA